MFIKLATTDRATLRAISSEPLSSRDPLAEWYKAAGEHPACGCVLDRKRPRQAFSRGTEENVLGDDFTEESFVIDAFPHLALLDPP